MSSHFVLPLACGGGRQSHHASLTQAESDLKKENIRTPNDAWKGYLKTWDCWNCQSSWDIAPEPLKGGGAYSAPLNP